MKVRHRESGYSLPELLVVVAIIGLVSLVTVPQFITYQQANRLKTSMRQFTNDLRLARQIAVSRHVRTKVAFADPSEPSNRPVRRYTVSQWNAAGSTWQTLDAQGRVSSGAARMLEQGTYLHSTTDVTNSDAAADLDIVFRSDGTTVLSGTATSQAMAMRTDWNVAKKQFDITVTLAGMVKVQ